VPADLWNEAARMTTSGLVVAAGAVPVALAAWWLRPRGVPALPPWRPWPVPWSGFAVAVAFLVVGFVLPLITHQLLDGGGFFQSVYGDDFPAPRAEGVEPGRAAEAAALRALWVGLLALPLQIGLLRLARSALYPGWRPPPGVGVATGVWLAVAGWLLLTPAVMLVHAAVNLVYQQLDWHADTHPLARLGNRPLLDQALFVLQACLVAPLVEEVLFRGVLLPWCGGRTRLPGAGVRPATALRPWFVMVAAGMFAAASEKPGALAFAGVLAFGLAAVWKLNRSGERRARAVYASAALFATVHSGVWPSPIPLFVLGLGLGWLALRTRGVLVPTAVHGLFNAVSVVFVLRGAA
jgi:membrane protease YdiL (CAAX protease family)